MENLLTSIINRLEDNAAVLGLSYIDEEYGQVDIIDDGSRDTYPVTFPAVLIDNAGEQWRQLGNGMQQAEASVNVNIYLDCYDDTHAYSTTVSKASERMALVRSVTELLQGWKPLQESGELTRTASSASTNNHGIKLYQVTFRTAYYEAFGSETTHTITNIKLENYATENDASGG